MGDLEKLKETMLESESVFDGRLLQVYRDRVQLPNGDDSTREYIKHPGASAVVPVFENGDVMLIRQYRYPLRRAFYEVPAGKIDGGEQPEHAATRELEEETGLSAGQLQYLAPFHPSIGYTDEVIHIYCAWNLSQNPRHADEDEFLLPHRLPFSEAVQMVYNGAISDGKTMVCLLMAWNWWQANAPFPIS